MTCTSLCRKIRLPSRPGPWSIRTHDATLPERPVGGRAGAGPRTLPDPAPFLEEGVPLARVARDRGLVLRTARRWVDRYRREGLAGLARKERSDKDRPQFSATLRQAIEGLALQKPRRSAAAIHRQAVTIAERLGESPPSYGFVYALIRGLDPALLTLAHEGTKAYADAFDLVHRHEATGPNAVWQADHTELDIWLKDGRGQPGKPWLTIILDDYSRAVAGYALSFSAPSAIQTALALRQAIWRKGRPGLAGLRHPGGPLFRPRQRLHVPAPRAGGRRPEDPPGQLRGGAAPRPGEDRAVLRERLPGAPVAAARLCARRDAPRTAELTLAELTARAGAVPGRRVPRRTPLDDGVQAAGAVGAGGFLPRMPESLEQLDLLLLTVPKTRRVHPDGIRFSGLRYIDPTLAAYVGEEVLLRYDPRDVAEVRVFHEGRFVCRAVCQELAGETVPLREVIRARDRRRRELRRTIQDRRKAVESLLEVRRGGATESDGRGRPGEPPGAATAGEDAQAVRR